MRSTVYGTRGALRAGQLIWHLNSPPHIGAPIWQIWWDQGVFRALSGLGSCPPQTILPRRDAYADPAALRNALSSVNGYRSQWSWAGRGTLAVLGQLPAQDRVSTGRPIQPHPAPAPVQGGVPGLLGRVQASSAGVMQGASGPAAWRVPARSKYPGDGGTHPACLAMARSSRLAQCSVIMPSRVRNQWVWVTANAFPVGGIAASTVAVPGW